MRNRIGQTEEQIILASDLDNTLIYSYRHEIGTNKVAVEWKDGKILSYMTAYAQNALKQAIRQVLFIPVSTRSVEQYQRIQFLEQGQPQYAIVSNGGVLLVEGKEDRAWEKETKDAIQSAMPALIKAQKLLEKDPERSMGVRFVDESFIFTKSKSPMQTLFTLKKQLPDPMVKFYHNGEKIYAIPTVLNKGNAIRRLIKKLANEGRIRLYAAGDSEFDLPMLELADIAFCPQKIGEMLQNKKQIRVISTEENVLSDVLFSSLLKNDFDSHKI